MQIVEMDVNDLNEYENNPRLNDDAVEYVARSIESFGFKNPIIRDIDFECDAVEENDFDVNGAVESANEPRVKRGQLWKLGDHSMLTNCDVIIERWEKLTGEKAELIKE